MFKVMNIENKPLPDTLPLRRVIGEREKEQKVMDKKSNLILRKESGAALVVALLMIVVLSLIGLASSSSSTFEIRLSGNKRGATDAFYSADSGLLSVMGNIASFSCNENPTPPALPTELTTENIDFKNTNPTFTLPNGYSFRDQPQVTVYHTTVTKAPRGLGLSATAFLYNYYIIDAVGKDQMDVSLAKSNCEIREKIVRLIPTGN
jgi:type IV pilus assembly protein PilX